MKAPLRPVLLLLLFVLVLVLLPACGGGGGGGGGAGGGFAPPPALSLDDGPLPPIEGFDNIAVSQANKEIVFKSSPTIRKTDDGILVVLYNGIEFFTGDGAYASEFFEGANFITGQKLLDSVRTEYPDPEGSYSIAQYRYAIFLGGKKLTLEYADFGIWLEARHYLYSSPDDYIDSSGIVTFGTFWTNTDGHWRPPAADQEFEGTAVAAVKNHDTNDAAFFSGTAQLKVTSPAGALRGELDLTFDKYYNFKLSNIQINDAGFMPEYPTPSVQITGGGNNLGKPEFDFDTGQSIGGDITGRFYGPEGGNASEAVGTFGIYNGFVNVYGAFGVKEKK